MTTSTASSAAALMPPSSSPPCTPPSLFRINSPFCRLLLLRLHPPSCQLGSTTSNQHHSALPSTATRWEKGQRKGGTKPPTRPGQTQQWPGALRNQEKPPAGSASKATPEPAAGLLLGKKINQMQRPTTSPGTQERQSLLCTHHAGERRSGWRRRRRCWWMPSCPRPLQEPLAGRKKRRDGRSSSKEEEENPTGGAGSSAWLVALWSAQQSLWLSICWLGEFHHLIRGVNSPERSLQPQGAGPGGGLCLPPNNVMVCSWGLTGGSLRLAAEWQRGAEEPLLFHHLHCCLGRAGERSP